MIVQTKGVQTHRDLERLESRGIRIDEDAAPIHKVLEIVHRHIDQGNIEIARDILRDFEIRSLTSTQVKELLVKLLNTKNYDLFKEVLSKHIDSLSENDLEGVYALTGTQQTMGLQRALEMLNKRRAG